MKSKIELLRQDIEKIIISYKRILEFHIENKQYSLAVEKQAKIESFELAIMMIDEQLSKKKETKKLDEPIKRPTADEWVAMIKEWVDANKPKWMKYKITILENKEIINYSKDKFWISVAFYTTIKGKSIGTRSIITQNYIDMTLHPYNVYGDLVCYCINEEMQQLIKIKEIKEKNNKKEICKDCGLPVDRCICEIIKTHRKWAKITKDR
jgi:hypothetical protein